MSNKTKIELYCLLGALLGLFIMFAITLQHAKAESPINQCDAIAYSDEFIPPDIPLRYRVLRGKKAKKLRKCSTVQCLIQNTPRNRHRVAVVFKRRRPHVAFFGGLGITRKNLFVGPRDKLEKGLLINAGVESCRFVDNCGDFGTLEENVFLDRDLHNRIAWDVQCVRKAGVRVKGFNELQEVP